MNIQSNIWWHSDHYLQIHRYTDKANTAPFGEAYIFTIFGFGEDPNIKNSNSKILLYNHQLKKLDILKLWKNMVVCRVGLSLKPFGGIWSSTPYQQVPAQFKHCSPYHLQMILCLYRLFHLYSLSSSSLLPQGHLLKNSFVPWYIFYCLFSLFHCSFFVTVCVHLHLSAFVSRCLAFILLLSGFLPRSL